MTIPEHEVFDISPDEALADTESAKPQELHKVGNELMQSCGEALYLISLDSKTLDVTFDKDYWAIVTQEDNEEFNVGWVSASEDSESDISNTEAVVNFLSSYEIPSLLFLPQGREDMVIAAVAAGAEYLEGEPAPLMYLKPGDLVEAVNLPEIELVNVNIDNGTLEGSLRIQAEALGFEVETLQRVFGEDVLSHEAVSVYLAKVNGRDVSTVTIVRHGNTVSIWNMGTSKESQRKGYGQALLQGVLQEARQQGVENAILIATEAGKRLYGKMGFVTAENLEVCVVG